MLRCVLARLKLRASDCVLVEDMLVNQKAARAIGMRTVWMQRYLDGRYRGPPHAGRPPNLGAKPRPAGVHPCPSPRYVRAKIHTLHTLLTL
jgi:putative hydrolase of the HAD superfamily